MNEWAAQEDVMVQRFMDIIARNDVGDTPNQWYQDWRTVVVLCGSQYGLTEAQSCCLFSCLSPRKNITRNWHMFVQCCKHGADSCKEATPATREKAYRIMHDAKNPLRYFSSRAPKTRAFAQNLMGDMQPVTVDSIMAQLATGEPTRSDVPLPLYKVIESAVQRVANMLGWQPAETQALLWTLARREKPTKKGRGTDIDVHFLHHVLTHGRLSLVS